MQNDVWAEIAICDLCIVALRKLFDVKAIDSPAHVRFGPWILQTLRLRDQSVTYSGSCPASHHIDTQLSTASMRSCQRDALYDGVW
jgi:hypothetical protein